MEIKNYQDFEAEITRAGVNMPKADKRSLVTGSSENPVWIHFGGGNLYRGFHAEIAQKLADAGGLSSGVIVCETFDEEIIDLAYRPYHNNFMQVVMHEDGTCEKSIINVTAESYYANPERPEDFDTVKKIMTKDSLQFATFTITEKGYNIFDRTGAFLQIIKGDIVAGPEKPKHTMSIIASLLYSRFQAGAAAIAMVSTDNFSRNGEKFKESILAISGKWMENGFVTGEFIDYLMDEAKVSFPLSMIDRITPNPSAEIESLLQKDGFQDTAIIKTSKHTNIASFANTEETHYLVIEDRFPNGRPPLEKTGVILTDRETVDKADAMKVTTCLNPLHTALAIFGCLLGYQSIALEMQDNTLIELIKGIGYREGLPVVVNPEIIDPKKFIDELIEKRLPNPMIPDTPQRIAADTSQKIPIRFGETIRKYHTSAEKSTEDLIYIPLAIAGWLRYLLGVTDYGEAFEPSPDPLLEDLQGELSGIKIRFTGSAHAYVQNILSNEQIFGMNLYEAGLGNKIEKYFEEMLRDKNAVRETLDKYVP